MRRRGATKFEATGCPLDFFRTALHVFSHSSCWCAISSCLFLKVQDSLLPRLECSQIDIFLSTCSKNASLIDIRGNAFSKYLVSENSYFYAEASSIFIFKGAAQKCQLLKIWQRNDEFFFINLCRVSIPCRLG